jgi:type IV secretory pathway ATPase VirB11/archaellum biosynthesis ATPase
LLQNLDFSAISLTIYTIKFKAFEVDKSSNFDATYKYVTRKLREERILKKAVKKERKVEQITIIKDNSYQFKGFNPNKNCESDIQIIKSSSNITKPQAVVETKFFQKEEKARQRLVGESFLNSMKPTICLTSGTDQQEIEVINNQLDEYGDNFVIGNVEDIHEFDEDNILELSYQSNVTELESAVETKSFQNRGS